MRHPKNNLQQTHKVCYAVTSASRNEQSIITLHELFTTYNSKLLTITTTRHYCYMRFKTGAGKFFYARGKNLPEAFNSLTLKMNTLEKYYQEQEDMEYQQTQFQRRYYLHRILKQKSIKYNSRTKTVFPSPNQTDDKHVQLLKKNHNYIVQTIID